MKRNWSLADVAQHWDKTVGYDEINAKTASYERRFTDSAPLFVIPSGAHVLDIDARTGIGSQFFYERNKDKNLSFTCLVVSQFFKDVATKRLQAANVPAVVQQFTNLPLPVADNTFDVTLSYETLEHVPWPRKYIQELVRVTKPGGAIVLTTPTVAWEPIHLLAPVLGLHHSEGPHRMVQRRLITSTFAGAACTKLKEKTTVFIPAGPPWLLALGEKLEAIVGEGVRRHTALRRIFIYRKDGQNLAKNPRQYH
ncbi:MAG: class I SAM-dependent methyltransferase [Candidatus Andersenbacteria bacterium]|nr:class I SAM-dependent methyltransferase [Candidatus Andersenbacteria bacterium]MBI3250248.1 class I SAM-dependent methyltransferase [Candidatus Andersenbacteria bacterium]